MKKYVLFILLSVLTIMLTACGSKSADQKASATDEEYVLKYNGEPGNVIPAELAEDLGFFNKVKLDYQGITKGGPESIQFVATNQLDFGNAFNAAIIKSVEKGVKIKGVITSYGSTKNSYVGFYTKKGSPVKEPKDLIGKKIAVNIRGAHLEMAVQQYLLNAGLTDADIAKVEFVTIPAISAEQTLLNGQVDVVGLNSIFRDKANEAGKTDLLFKDTDPASFDGEYNAGSYFFRDEFIKEHPEVVEDFTQGVAKAYEWLKTTDREEVIARMTKIMNERERDEPVENLKYWHESGVETAGGILQDSDYERFLQQLEKAGDIKTANVNVAKYYTNEFNPNK